MLRCNGNPERADLVGKVAVGRHAVGADDHQIHESLRRMIEAAALVRMISVTSTPACCNSNAVRRAPCSSGRVSSANTLKVTPSRCAA